MDEATAAIAPAEATRRAKIAAAKRGKPRPPEVCAKQSATRKGMYLVERHPDEVTLNELKALSGHGYRILAGWRDSGDAPGRWVAQPGAKPDVFLFDRGAALERLSNECERPACRWPALAAGECCSRHQDPDDVKVSLAELAAGAVFTRWWLTEVLQAVRPDLRGRRRPLTKRELEQLLAELPTCTRRGCSNPAGPTGRCWVRGHYAWLRPRPTFQKFGRGSEERRCAGGCGKWLVIRGYRLARRREEHEFRCISCTVRHFFADPERKARWALHRHDSTRLFGVLGREAGKRGGRTKGKFAELSREVVLRILQLDRLRRSQREIADDVGVKRAKIQRVLAHVRKHGAESVLKHYPAA